MLRPGADAREAELLQHAAKGHLGQINTKTVLHHTLEIDATPAHDPVLLRIGSVLDELLQYLLLLV